MKKDKKVKGLVVSKETLRQLDDKILNGVVGGMPPYTRVTQCRGDTYCYPEYSIGC